MPYFILICGVQILYFAFRWKMQWSKHIRRPTYFTLNVVDIDLKYVPNRTILISDHNF